MASADVWRSELFANETQLTGFMQVFSGLGVFVLVAIFRCQPLRILGVLYSLCTCVLHRPSVKKSVQVTHHKSN